MKFSFFVEPSIPVEGELSADGKALTTHANTHTHTKRRKTGEREKKVTLQLNIIINLMANFSIHACSLETL